MAGRNLLSPQYEKSDKKTGGNLLKQENKHSALKEAAVGIPRGFTTGLWNTIHEILNSPHNITALFSEEAAKKVPYKELPDYRAALGGTGEAQDPEKIAEFAGEIAPALLLPEAELGVVGSRIAAIPKVGKFVKKAIGEAIPQAGYAALTSEQPITSAGEAAATTVPFSLASYLMESKSPLLRMSAKGVSGLLAGILGHEAAQGIGLSETGQEFSTILAAILGSKAITTKKDTIKKITEGIGKSPTEERLAAAKRLNLEYLTPAEASLNPFLAKLQGNLGRTSEGSKLLFEKGEQRLTSEEKAITDLFDTVYNKEKLSPEMDRYYAEAKSKKIPENVILSFLGNDIVSGNEIIGSAIKKVEKDPAYKEKLKFVPKDSIEYWNHVKIALDDMVESAKGKGEKNRASIISEARNSLRNEMDLISPEYKKGRELAERGFVRKNLENAFKKNEITGTNFYKMIGNKDVFDRLMFSLRNVPEAQSKLADMRMLFKDLINTPTVKTAAGLEKTSMVKPRSTGQLLENLVHQVFSGGQADKQAIEFITNPNWSEELSKINQISDKQAKSTALINLMGRAVAQENSKKETPNKNELQGMKR